MKILVVHPAQQHSYRLATALAKKGWLYKYITTVYWKEKSFTKLVSFFLRGDFRKKAMARCCPTLSPDQVIQFCELEGLLKLLTMHVRSLRPLYRAIKYHTADRFAKKVANYAIKHHVDAVVSYDDSSSLLFELLEKKAPDILRIMDMSAANILYMRRIYDRDTELQPSFSDRLHKERAVVWNENNIARAEKELKYTQIFLVPSKFVARTLRDFGVPSEHISICPYGVDTLQFKQKEYPDQGTPTRKPIRFIYVGGVKELKGISYLLQAFSRLSSSQAKLTIVGQADLNDEDIRPYIDRVAFTGQVLHTEIPKLLMESDVFVLPSLGEGLSLATLEAASCGLPLIVSENSGVDDAMTEGKEGFVIPIQSTAALVEKMQWFIEHPKKIQPMGKAARDMAMRYTWDNYYIHMGRVFDEIEKNYGQNS